MSAGVGEGYGDQAASAASARPSAYQTRVNAGQIYGAQGSNGANSVINYYYDPRTGEGRTVYHPAGSGGAGGPAFRLYARASLVNVGAITGGRGGAGGSSRGYYAYGHGGAGGAGGAGVISTGGALLNAGGTLRGGDGGAGGNPGADAGAGGPGLILANAGSVTLAGIISGGDGGAAVNPGGGSLSHSAGDGGAGGCGVVVTAFANLFNAGQVSGGGGGLGGGVTPYYSGEGGAGGDGIDLTAGGRLTNAGIIEGGVDAGTAFQGGGGFGDGVRLSAPGTLVNGQSGAIEAHIGYARYQGAQDIGGNGVELSAGGRVANTGTIEGGLGGEGLTDRYNRSGDGVVLTGGGTLVNGASGLISGQIGVYAVSGATVIDSGVIVGTRGVALAFGSASDRLIARPGASFQGLVAGGGGALELATGAGTISGLGASGTVSGTLAMTCSGFGAYVIDAGGSWTLTGANALAAAQTLAVAGAVTLDGSLSTAGTLAGDGTFTLAGGAFDLATTSQLDIATILQNGASVATFEGPSPTFGGAWIQNGGVITVDSGATLHLTGVDSRFQGTLAGAGAVVFGSGADLISGATLAARAITIDGAAITLAGAVAIDHALIVVNGAEVAVDGAGASLTGGGQLVLSNVIANRIVGAGPGAALTNLDDRISGAGDLGGGSLTLINGHGALINANQSQSLTIDTGAQTIANAGVIESTAAGGLRIASAINNSGVLAAAAGTLTLAAAVTGSGSVRIRGGAVAALATFSQNVLFVGVSGSLTLAHSASYAGAISGFSKTGGTSLDLLDINFVSGTTKATYKDNGLKTGGVLTVTDGTHTAKLNLVGDYNASTFVVANDGAGHALVHDPAAPAAAPAPFVQAMAGFAGPAAGLAAVPRNAAAMAAPLLAAPRLTAIA